MGRVPRLYAAELDGIDAHLIEVEADLNVGLHSFSIVGLADKAVSEAKERVNSALKNSGVKPPTRENRRITINLAPADRKKAGSRFDLPIAIAYLLASDQIKPFQSENKLFVGELSLDGSLRGVSGCLNIALCAREKNINELFVPIENAPEASFVSGVRVFGVSNLKDLIHHLEGTSLIAVTPQIKISSRNNVSNVTLDDIKGNEAAKRALTVAAAGGHNMLLTGPPGTGKTMLANALSSILPPTHDEEAIEITKIYSAAGLTNGQKPFISWRPFRAPHNSASAISILGGGTIPKPGEVSLSHRGVLFLDEVAEFNRDVLEGLRQPLENGTIHIARAKQSLIFPARFTLIAAMNPCPCGYFEDPSHECVCSAHDIARYQKKLSGPLLDRIDIQIEVPRISITELRSGVPIQRDGNATREKVASARELQNDRFKNRNETCNAEIPSKDVDTLVPLEKDAETFLKQTLERRTISARGYYRTLKVARTIADLDSTEKIKKEHLAEAFHYRIRADN